jgi:carboxymethylenebutenolidase
MIEEEIEIPTPDGTCDGFLYWDDDGRPRPGVIHLTDIAGIRPSHHEMARRLAEAGYCVLLPNVFYRNGRPPMFDFTPSPGDERTMKRFAELAAPLTPEAMQHDAAACVDFLAGQESAAKGPIGVVGYCFTGAMAMRMAAVRPEKIAAAASFHGGGLFTETPASPHLVLSRVKAQLYFGHASKDRTMPEEAIAKLDRALEAWGGEYESEVYEAFHGWTVSDSPVFDREQCDYAFEKLTALFGRTLK